MSKNKKKISENKTSSHNASEKINLAVNAAATDNQNINQNHNTKKEALGPNTKR